MASPLASIYSTADSFKRKLLDVLTDPTGSAQQIVGNANDRAGVLNALTGQLADQTMSSIKAGGSVMPDTPESQRLTQMMADAYNPAGMIVYHGSPFKFDAFDPAKIGSGARAQAYGYGHYTAQNPETATAFRVPTTDTKNLRPTTEDTIAFDVSHYLGEDIGAHAGSRAKSTQRSGSDLKYIFDDGSVGIEDSYGAFTAYAPPESYMYKIDLPDEQIAKMLSWDKEISKQTPEIQRLAKQYGLSGDDLGGDLIAAMDAKRPAGAEAMRAAGVTGVRYPDAKMRSNQNNGMENFVVFPQSEGLLNILERNGVPLK